MVLFVLGAFGAHQAFKHGMQAVQERAAAAAAHEGNPMPACASTFIMGGAHAAVQQVDAVGNWLRKCMLLGVAKFVMAAAAAVTVGLPNALGGMLRVGLEACQESLLQTFIDFHELVKVILRLTGLQATVPTDNAENGASRSPEPTAEAD
ncbi:hypothetical protein ABPG75_000149 [Micractinium tetrahymenae]